MNLQNKKENLIKVSKSSRMGSNDDAYNGESLLVSQLSKFYSLLEGKGHWAEKMKRMDSLMGDLSGKKLLDLGTQIGTYALYLSKAAKFCIGIDFAEEAIKIANKNRSKLNIINTRFIQANVASIPFKNESFDVVIGCDIVEHLVDDNLNNMIKESFRVLKKKGILILQTYPNRYHSLLCNLSKYSIIPILLFWLPKKIYNKFIQLYYKTIVYIKSINRKLTSIESIGTHINCQTLNSISKSVKVVGFEIEKEFAENTYSIFERSKFSKFMERLLRNNTVTKQNIYIKAIKF